MYLEGFYPLFKPEDPRNIWFIGNCDVYRNDYGEMRFGPQRIEKQFSEKTTLGNVLYLVDADNGLRVRSDHVHLYRTIIDALLTAGKKQTAIWCGFVGKHSDRYRNDSFKDSFWPETLTQDYEMYGDRYYDIVSGREFTTRRFTYIPAQIKERERVVIPLLKHCLTIDPNVRRNLEKSMRYIDVYVDVKTKMIVRPTDAAVQDNAFAKSGAPGTHAYSWGDEEWIKEFIAKQNMAHTRIKGLYDEAISLRNKRKEWFDKIKKESGVGAARAWSGSSKSNWEDVEKTNKVIANWNYSTVNGQSNEGSIDKMEYCAWVDYSMGYDVIAGNVSMLQKQVFGEFGTKGGYHN